MPTRSVSVQQVIGAGEASILAVAVTALGTIVSARTAGWRDDRDRERKAKEAAAQRHEDLVTTAADAVNRALHAFERRRTSDEETVKQEGQLFDEEVLGVALIITRVSLYFSPAHRATEAYKNAHAKLITLRERAFDAQSVSLPADFADGDVNEARAALSRFEDAAGTGLKPPTRVAED